MPRRKSTRYARALIDLAERYGALEEVNSSLKILSDLHEADRAFRLLFFTRRIEPSKKVEILSSVMGDRVHPIALEFLALLGEKRDHELLAPTAARYEVLFRRRTNRAFVTAVTSVPLGDEAYGEIHRRLESSLRKWIDLEKEVDPRLIGGIKLRIGNTLLDGSVSTRLEKLKGSLL